MKTKSHFARRISNRLYRLTQQIIGDKRKPQPRDIYIASYPRSGNTWIRFLLANLLEPKIDWNLRNIDRVIPDIHQRWPSEWIERYPRILKTHHPYQSSYHRAVYIIRDGRDVAVSYYDYLTRIKSYGSSFDQFLSDYLAGQVWFGSWHEHVESWQLNINKENILVIKYEELTTNPNIILGTIGNFLNLDQSQQSILNAVKRTNFNKLRNEYQDLKPNELVRKGTPGVKGGPGKWKEVFTNEENERYWSIAGKIADKCGYTKF